MHLTEQKSQIRSLIIRAKNRIEVSVKGAYTVYQPIRWKEYSPSNNPDNKGYILISGKILVYYYK